MPSTDPFRSTPYCPSLTAYQRFQTREVKVGKLRFGGNNPIRIQSMTTTNSMDTEATVAQSIRMIEAGCELVRITAPGKKEAANLAHIKAALLKKGYDTPLVADIHFTPNAAEIAAALVEKVRINPGNYADKKKFAEMAYTDESYRAELERIRKRFTPLVKICKTHHTAMRIGTNHGSLSDRIMSRYGDTPRGMVESAMEFLRICRDNDFHDIILSMKASNPQVMVQAYRLLVAIMIKEGMNYPLHLGVTEAGDGEDGRIKSAIGIGALLEDGLGDTLRVSLTEEPEFELPVAQLLADRYRLRNPHDPIPPLPDQPFSPFEYRKRKSHAVANIGDKHIPVVVADLRHKTNLRPSALFGAGYHYSVPLDKWNLSDFACDFIHIGDQQLGFELPGTLGVMQNAASWDRNKERHFPVYDCRNYPAEAPSGLHFLQLCLADLTPHCIRQIRQRKTLVLILETNNRHAMPEMRRAMALLQENQLTHPVILHRHFEGLPEEKFQLYSSTDTGALLLDGLGDGLWLSADKVGLKSRNSTAFGILQATRTRISKTEYISCPSCGRTLFDLQETTARIRAKTHHLKGIKIGIMGCIVNGPGEMADADYGYVGTGPGKITLYKEKQVVQRNVPAENAVDALIELIRAHGDWTVPPPSVEVAGK